MTEPARYRWHTVRGETLTCNEKIAVLEKNMAELEQLCRDALDDALLMGCSCNSAKAALHNLIDHLIPSVKERL